MSPEKDEKQEKAFKEGYERARLEMFRELEQLIGYYAENNKRPGVDVLVHVRSVLRSMKPYQKPWDPYRGQS